jgi:hypothetical protein
LNFFRFFGVIKVKKWLVFSSKGQICIPTIEFEFKWTNQKLTAHYHPSTPVASGSVGYTARALPLGLAPVHAVPLGPGRCYPCRPCEPPHHLHQAVPPDRLALPPPGRAVALPTETSLSDVTITLVRLAFPHY